MVASPSITPPLRVRYESYWSSIHSRTAALTGGLRGSEAELVGLCDAAVRAANDWQRLRAELDGLATMEESIRSLSDSIARLSVRFDRLDQSLSLCLSNRELHLSAQFTQKRDVQLERQRSQHQKAARELRSELESATKAAALSYRQATSVDPPLLHPQPLPNAEVTTAYGSAQLGAVIKPIQITKFSKKTAQPHNAQLPPTHTPANFTPSSTATTNPTSSTPLTAGDVASSIAAEDEKEGDAAVAAVSPVVQAGAGEATPLVGDALVDRR